MDFSLTDERRMLRDSLTGTLSRHGRDADLWSRLAELGIGQALLTPEQGGFGGEGPDIALIFRELGHSGAVTPALDSVLKIYLEPELEFDPKLTAVLDAVSAHLESGIFKSLTDLPIATTCPNCHIHYQR